MSNKKNKTQPAGSKLLTVRMAPEDVETLNAIRQYEYGLSDTNVVKKMLRLLRWLLEQEAGGAEIQVKKGEKVVPLTLAFRLPPPL